MGTEDLLPLLGRLNERGIPAWLDGGWGIDALLGEQTREHDDVDLIATVADSPRLIAALGELGYELAAGATSTNYVLLDLAGRQVDVHPVTFTFCHNAADYQFDDDDYRDLQALHVRFGVAVPPDVLAWSGRRST